MTFLPDQGNHAGYGAPQPVWNPAHSSSESCLWKQTHCPNEGRPAHFLHKRAAAGPFPVGYEPVSSAPGPGYSSCATWVRASRLPLRSRSASPQHSLTDRYYKAQPISGTNRMVNLLLYSFYRFYLLFPWANKYTKTKEDQPDSLRLRLFNDFLFP